jgi:hypothetical protein
LATQPDMHSNRSGVFTLMYTAAQTPPAHSELDAHVGPNGRVVTPEASGEMVVLPVVVSSSSSPGSGQAAVKAQHKASGIGKRSR